MNLIAKARGHVVYVRCPTDPPSWEAACECGYRSAKYHDETDAILDGHIHADNAPVRVEAKPKRPIRRKPTKRGK